MSKNNRMLKPNRVEGATSTAFSKAPAALTQLNRIDEITLTRCSKTVFSEVDSDYLSFSIDISVLCGGSWWEGSNAVKKGLGGAKISPLNLDNERLDQLTKPLAPFYIRLGGSEADTIAYFQQGKKGSRKLLLTRSQWDSLHHFMERHHLKLYFTAKYGLFNRRQHGAWDGRKLNHLLEYCDKRQQKISIAELGNELNAYWIFHGVMSQPGAKKLARDYERFSTLMRDCFPGVKISGPGSAFWPRLGEPITPFSNLTKAFLREYSGRLDIIDWHYYPFQSRRSPVRTRTASQLSMINPRSYQDFEKYSRLIQGWRDQYHPEAEVWTGESGSAQCGGQQGLSDRWVSSFWWADQLGLGAKLGQRVMVRQSLIGGDYGLIDRNSLEPRPDYWVSVFWAKLMGTKVHPVESPDKHVRSYCHENHLGEKTLLIINLADDIKSIDCADFGDVSCQYELSADSLDSKDIRVNNMSSTDLKPSFELADIPVLPVTTEVKGRTINFWKL